MEKQHKTKMVVEDFLTEGVIDGDIDEEWIARVLVDAFDDTDRIKRLIQEIVDHRRDYIEDFYEDEDEVYNQLVKLDGASQLLDLK